MKLFTHTILLLFTLVLYENNAYSLSNYQIREICKNKRNKSKCIKNLNFKKLNLLQGNQIEIPVIPFKK